MKPVWSYCWPLESRWLFSSVFTAMHANSCELKSNYVQSWEKREWNLIWAILCSVTGADGIILTPVVEGIGCVAITENAVSKTKKKKSPMHVMYAESKIILELKLSKKRNDSNQHLKKKKYWRPPIRNLPKSSFSWNKTIRCSGLGTE